MRIAIASGKGGTGKTFVAVNLALTAARRGRRVHLCDCDVEEPNAHLFVKPQTLQRREVDLSIPVIDAALCEHCGACAALCRFNALACLPTQTMVFADLCHSCGGCWLVCPQQAIARGRRVLGEVASGTAGPLEFTQGRLRVGETVVPPLIAEVQATPRRADWVVLDAPPGTTCPVVATLRRADYVVLVTEPTPFGRHDLALAAELCRALDLPCGVVINRAVGGRDETAAWCAAQGLAVLARIPFRRGVAAACAEGRLAIDADPEVAALMDGLHQRLADLAVAP